MSGHTKGPWAQDFYESSDGRIEFYGWISGADGANVVEYAGCGSHDAEWANPADLTLALAAPDLLEALESCIALFDEHDDCSDIDTTVSARNAARAAIAKARGAK